MEFNQILELIDHVSASELTAFTYETADLTLSMEHGKPQIIQGVMGGNCGKHSGGRNGRWKSPQGSAYSADGRCRFRGGDSIRSGR